MIRWITTAAPLRSSRWHRAMKAFHPFIPCSTNMRSFFSYSREKVVIPLVKYRFCFSWREGAAGQSRVRPGHVYYLSMHRPVFLNFACSMLYE
jgi:hypothetical protein